MIYLNLPKEFNSNKVSTNSIISVLWLVGRLVKTLVVWFVIQKIQNKAVPTLSTFGGEYFDENIQHNFFWKYININIYY